MRRLGLLVLVVIGLPAAAGLVPATAAVTDGGVLVGPASGTTTPVQAVALTPSALALIAGPPSPGVGITDLWTEAPTGGVAHLARTGSDAIVSAAGDRLLIRTSPSGRAWYDTGTGSTGTAPGGWLAAAQDGGLVLQPTADGSVVLLDQAVNGTTRSLGTVPGLASSQVPTTRVLADSAGAAVVASSTIQYLDYATSTFAPVDTTDVVTNDCIGIHRGVIGCTSFALTQASIVLARLQAGHAPVVQMTALDAGLDVDDIEVSPTGTAIAYHDSTKPNGEQGVKVLRLDGAPSPGVSQTQQVAPTDDGFLASNGSGIVHIGSTSSSPPAGLLPPPAISDAAITTGRVAWSQPTSGAGVEYGQTYAWAEAVVTVGSYAAVGNVPARGTGSDTAASGTRTVFNGRTTPYVVTGGGRAVRLPLCAAAARPVVSGVRALCTAPNGHLIRYDLVTLVGVDMTATAGITSGATTALSGADIFFVGGDGWISRYDITTGTSVHVVAATGTQQVLAAGDWVAWTTDGATVRWTRWDVPGAATRTGAGRLVGVSAAGVVASTDATGTSVLRPWGGAAAVALPAHTVGVSGATALYLAGNTPFLLALAHRPDRPRSLGNPDIPATVRTGTPWNLDLPTTTSLTHCEVVVTSGATQVRALACDATAAAQGEAVVSWNGRDTAGHVVPPGGYRWSIRASNRDGSLLDVDGDTAVVRGIVTVTS